MPVTACSCNAFIALAAPAVPTIAGLNVTGGSLVVGQTYYYVITALDLVGGETLHSTQASYTILSGQNATQVSWTTVAGAAGYRIYRGTTSGTWNLFYVVGPNATSFTDTGAAAASGSPPASATAYVFPIT